MRKVAVLLFVVFMGLMCESGCGRSDRPSLVKASGKVQLNGEPLEGATVTFQFLSEKENGKYGRPSYATSDAQGAFTVNTYGSGDGMPIGKYKVTVFKQDVVGDLPADYNPENPTLTPIKFKWTVPKHYSDPSTSGLNVEVTAKGLVPSTIELTAEGKPEIDSSIPRRRSDDP